MRLNDDAESLTMMNDEYGPLLVEFKQEISHLNKSSFANWQAWKLSTETLNGVLIGKPVEGPADRKQLHRIGQKYGLIPICPGDLIDLDFTGDPGKPFTAVVVTSIGKLPIGASEE